MEEVHRFENIPVEVNGTLYWDILRIIHEIRQGMTKAHNAGGFDSVAVDTWGVDYGLVTETGLLISNPIHYRDSRTTGMIEKTETLISADELYKLTGIGALSINTIYQLMAEKAHRPYMLKEAKRFLLTPDLINYILCGQQATEASIASTTGLFNAAAKDWSWSLIDALGLPRQLFAPVVPSGTVLGKLNAELGLQNQPLLVAACGHDTQCAQIAVPASEEDFIFISCGTWALLGTELDSPILTEEAQRLGLSNESGFGGKTSFLQNITGTWLLQESRRQWQREGQNYSFAELEEMARSAPPLQSIIDPNAPCFTAPGNIPQRIRDYCQETGQPVPQNTAALVRCIYESLALRFRKSVEDIETCTGKTYSTIHMLGGGVKDRLLCQMTADACNCTVIAGPNEATVWGNILAQLIALGKLQNLTEARALVRNCGDLTTYTPSNTDLWNAPYNRRFTC
jgi:rhamnulokinase/L-fuculokinase